MARKEHEVEVGDYVQLHGEEIGEWFRITNKNLHGFDCVNDFGTPSNRHPYADITDLKLESEMEYNF